MSKILVYQMPWILNAAWKIVKSLLPAPAVARISFVSNVTLQDLVSSEFGPLNTWPFDWIPEIRDVSAQPGAPIEEEKGVQIFPEKNLIFGKELHGNLEAEILIKNRSS